MSTATQLNAIERKLDRIIKMLRIQTIQSEVTMAGIDDILAEVAELDDINDSLDALFAKLQELIAAGDPVKTAQALDIIVAQKARTKAAIVANTPAAPPTV